MPIKTGWSMLELVLDTSPQAVHDLLKQFEFKIKEKEGELKIDV